MAKEEHFPDEGRIDRFKVPDDDMQNWVEVFRQAGFSQEQVDDILIRLNDTYAAKKLGELVASEIERIESMYEKGGKKLNDQQREGLRRLVFEKMRKTNYEDLKQGIPPTYRD